MQMQTQGKTVVIVTHDVEFVAECNPRVVLMKEGKIVAEGSGKEILTNPEVLAESSIVLPQIAQIFAKLAPLGFPKNVIDIYEAEKIILNAKESKTANERFRRVKIPESLLSNPQFRPKNKIRLRHLHFRRRNHFRPNHPAAFSVRSADSICSVSACAEAVASFVAGSRFFGSGHLRS